jgi:hypothetical protein
MRKAHSNVDLVFFMTELVLVTEFLKRMGGDEPATAGLFSSRRLADSGIDGKAAQATRANRSLYRVQSQSKRWHCIGRTAIRRHDCQTFN